MAFSTNADMKNGFYGINKYDANKKRYIFYPLGNAVKVNDIVENIETGAMTLSLSWEYQGSERHLDIPREALTDHTLLQRLTSCGADITKQHMNVFVDSIRLQEHWKSANGGGTTKVCENLGWITIPGVDASGAPVEHLCYRAHTMVGASSAKYVGALAVEPKGTFADWQQMVVEEIIGHIPAEVVMLASLSAVVNGLIASKTTGENPILHINGLSGTGKSAIAMAAASVYGEPFDGERIVSDANGNPKSVRSVYGTWGATENAVLGRCAGNRGCAIILNELGKCKVPDLTGVTYNFSEGTDKDRMNGNLKIVKLEGYTATIISVGEHSYLARCKSKAEGVANRVLELDMPMARSAGNADKMKALARKNNGWAAPMLAEYIINNGGEKMVVDCFNQCYKDLLEIWPEAPSRERFVRKFPALFLTTAKLASAALGLSFHEESIIKFFVEREKDQGSERNAAAKSYDLIIEKCRVNINKFFIRRDKSIAKGKTLGEMTSVPSQDCWGRATYMVKPYADGRVIVQEFEVRPSVVEKILHEGGFENRATCIAEWKKLEVLDFEGKGHATRSRKIDESAPKGSKEEVYVFRVFCDPEEAQEYLDALAARDAAKPQKTVLLRCSTNRDLLLAEGGDDDETAHTA